MTVNKPDSEKTMLAGQLQTLQSQIKKTYPQLLKALNIEDTLSINAIKKNILDTATAVVEYFKGDSSTYAFYISPAGDCIMQQLGENIDSTINFFRDVDP